MYARYGSGPQMRELYVEHTTRYHPEFAAWEKRTDLYATLDGLLLVATFLLFLFSSLSSSPTYTIPSGVVFALASVLSASLFFKIRKRRVAFRESWKEEQGVFDASPNR
jgi:hypothetical protein